MNSKASQILIYTLLAFSLAISISALGLGIDCEVNKQNINYVQGPDGSTNTALVRFNNTTGKIIQNSNVLLSDDSKLSANDNIIDLSSTGTLNLTSNNVTTSNNLYCKTTRPVCSGIYTITSEPADFTSDIATSYVGTGLGSLQFPANTLSIGDTIRFTMDGTIIITSTGSSLSLFGIFGDGSLEGTTSIETDFTIPDTPVQQNIHYEGMISIRTIGTIANLFMSVFSVVADPSDSNYVPLISTRTISSSVNSTVDNQLDFLASWGSSDTQRHLFVQNFNVYSTYFGS